MMKRLAVLLVLALAIFAAGPTNATTLADLISGNDTISWFDKLFTDWGFESNNPDVTAADIVVTTIGSQPLGPDFLGLQFSGPLFASNGQTFDYALQYSVAVAPGSPYLIDDIGQSFNVTNTNGGTVAIGETVFKDGFFLGNPIAQSTISLSDVTDPPAELIQGDSLMFDPVSKVYVTKDVLVSAGPDSTVGATILNQRFSQAVPEPGTLLLLGSGLIGLAAYRRIRG